MFMADQLGLRPPDGAASCFICAMFVAIRAMLNKLVEKVFFVANELNMLAIFLT